MFLSMISSAKDELISPEEMLRNAGNDFVAQKAAQVYEEYQQVVHLHFVSKEIFSFYLNY